MGSRFRKQTGIMTVGIKKVSGKTVFHTCGMESPAPVYRKSREVAFFEGVSGFCRRGLHAQFPDLP